MLVAGTECAWKGGKETSGRELLSLSTCERGWAQEGRAPRGDLGCSPSGFRQVMVAICVPYLLLCEKGITS